MGGLLRTPPFNNNAGDECMTGVRHPKDDEECRKARLALALGMGTSLVDVVTEFLGHEPDEAFLGAVKNRIEFAQETQETIDLKVLIKQMVDLQNENA
jgi:hypothetical protein